MTKTLAFAVQAEEAGLRVDSYLTAQTDLTRNAAQRLCEEGMVRVCGAAVNKNRRLQPGEQVEVDIPAAKPLDVLPQNIPLNIVYEDDDLIVVNKPKGMVVHPAPGNEDGTLVNALLYHCGGSLSGIGGVARPGIVHRIDKDTSGLLVVAKTDLAHQSLAGQIKAHDMGRRYQAVVYGRLKQEKGSIHAPIGRHPIDRKKMCVTDKHAREAATRYHVLSYLDDFTHVELELETGRTHQIRVHMAYIGHPVAGDPVYGPKKVITSLMGQCLHAKTLGIVHPRTGERMQFDSELPDYFTEFLRKHTKGEG